MKLSGKAAVRDALLEDKRARKQLHTGTSLSAISADSFVNFAQKLGVGADNPLSTGSYGYNPITRNRLLLEWIHRGSWLGGVAVDLVADDMTRMGVDILSEMKPDDSERLEAYVNALGCWDQTNETIRWGRLYGGAIAVMMIDGQDWKTPLSMKTVGKGQFKGLLSLDRWMIEPSLEDLITDYGPNIGLPKYYKIQSNAPALRGQVVHYSRIAMRLVGIQLPYQQRLTENLWGISVLERLYDRMLAFDSASTGAAQLVYKSYLRTLKIDGLRDLVSAGGSALNGVMAYTDIMRRFQSVEGITLLDKDDEFEIQGHQAFSGLSDALNQFGQQLSGALQIPLVRLFGQSPAGLNSSGESDIRTYYDGIRQQQRKTMGVGMTKVYQCAAQSAGIPLPPNFKLDFTSLWQLDDVQKADVASKVSTTVSGAMESGIIGRQTALRELRQNSKTTGIFTNISQETIEAADDEVAPPMPEEGAGADPGGLGGPPEPGGKGPDNELGEPNEVRPQKTARKALDGPLRRVLLQYTA